MHIRRIVPLLLLALAAPGQAESEVPALRAALDEAFRQRDWRRCVGAAEALVCVEPDSATAWHRLGYALHALGDLDAALAAHERCANLTGAPAEIRRLGAYNAGCANALKGQPDQAIVWLRRAVELGFDRRDTLERDEDLDSLRTDPRFAELLAGVPDHRLCVAIVVHDGVDLLDFAGPAEVFSVARTAAGAPLFEVYLVAPEPGAVVTTSGVTIEPHHTLAAAPPCDLLVIPGGNTRVLLQDAAFLAWTRERIAACRTVLTVCSGAFVLAELGELDGREATTHHGARRGLATMHPGVKVVDRRVVDVGRIVTSAGVSAGIDGALYVVGRTCGKAVADAVADHLEYTPRHEPPENATPPGRDGAGR